MKKRITTLIMAAVMVFTAVGFTTVESDASTAASYVLLNDVNFEYSKIKEKVGDYYVWTDTNMETGTDKLKCSKFLGVSTKNLKTVSGSGKDDLLGAVVTNGYTIYYAVGTHGKYMDSYDQVTIYKTNVKGTSTTKIKTLTNIHSLAGYYDGKLYYSGLIDGFYAGSLYSYDLSSKKTKLVTKAYGVEASQGKNFVLGGSDGYYYYNVKTGKKVQLPEAEKYAVSGSKIFYNTEYERDDGEGSYLAGDVVKSCDFSGKNVKNLKTFEYGTWDGLVHFGQRYAFVVKPNGAIYRYNYNSGSTIKYITYLGKTTLTSVKSSGKNSITLKWNKVANAAKYQVYRSTSKNGTYKLVKITTSTSYKNTGLTTGKTYYYKVRAAYSDARGAYSVIKSAKPAAN